jgi:maltooligosyltrehalose trehalohydrolase
MSVQRLKIGAAAVLCSPFIPMLFQGEEFGASSPFQYFTNHRDRELGRAVTEGRRQGFAAQPGEAPDPQDPETFRRSKLNWDELAHEPHAGLLGWHKQLIALRRRIPELTDGQLDRVEVQFSEEESWLSFRRGEYVIALNLSAQVRTLPMPFCSVMMLASDTTCIVRGAGVELPPDSVAILRKSI